PLARTRECSTLVEGNGEARRAYREQPERRLKPRLSHLTGPGHNLLITNAGPLDILGTIGSGHAYEDLLPFTTNINVGNDIQARVLSLGKLIQMKEEAGRDKDKAA